MTDQRMGEIISGSVRAVVSAFYAALREGSACTGREFDELRPIVLLLDEAMEGLVSECAAYFERFPSTPLEPKIAELLRAHRWLSASGARRRSTGRPARRWPQRPARRQPARASEMT